MGIIVKFIIKNIREKKLRTFLIIFSIMISTALFLSSLAASDNLGRMAMERAKAYVGMAEILVYAGDKSPSRFFTSAAANTLINDMEFISRVFQGGGSYKFRSGKDIETVGFELGGLDGIDPETLKSTGRITIDQEKNLYPFNGNKIIIGKFTSEKYGMKLGDTIEIYIEGKKHRFTVAGVAKQEGIYLDDPYSRRITIPIETLSSIYGLKGKVTHLLIKPKNDRKKQYFIEQLSKIYDKYVVKETITKQELDQVVQEVTVPLFLALVLVVLISVFIIYASFKVITAERLLLTFIFL